MDEKHEGKGIQKRETQMIDNNQILETDSEKCEKYTSFLLGNRDATGLS